MSSQTRVNAGGIFFPLINLSSFYLKSFHSSSGCISGIRDKRLNLSNFDATCRSTFSLELNEQRVALNCEETFLAQYFLQGKRNVAIRKEILALCHDLVTWFISDFTSRSSCLSCELLAGFLS